MTINASRRRESIRQGFASGLIEVIAICFPLSEPSLWPTLESMLAGCLSPYIRWDLTSGSGSWIGTVAVGTTRLLVLTVFGGTRLLSLASGELLQHIY
jgi:hypothetical protein